MNWLDWLLTAARFVSLTGAILLTAIFGFYLINGPNRDVLRSHFPAEKWILIFELTALFGQAAWLCGLLWSLDPEVGPGGFEACQVFFFGTQVGRIGLIRCGLLLILVAYRVLFSRGSPTIVTWMEPALAFVQLAFLSWLSHAAAAVGPSSWIQLGTDLLHLMAAAIWPGGLIPLWLLLKRDVPETIKHNILVRFSRVSVVVAPLVGATGLLSAYFRMHAVAPLITTPYGHYVALKAACFFVMIGLGAVNRFRLIPGLRGTPSDGPFLVERWRRLQRNVLMEQAFLIVVLLAVAHLGLLAPPQ